jgi:hypothetical protein
LGRVAERFLSPPVETPGNMGEAVVMSRCQNVTFYLARTSQEVIQMPNFRLPLSGEIL